VIALAACANAQATIQCTFQLIQIDSNEVAPIDVDGDGTNDFLLFAEESPYVNNYIVGVSGNEIEVRSGGGVEHWRARRITSGDPVGQIAWNDTAYLIQNGQGAFAGGTEEYGHVGLRLSKEDGYHYAFLEVRAFYWNPFLAVYSWGYNDEALAQTRTDACPHPVGIADRNLSAANAFINGNYLHVSLGSDVPAETEVQLISISGQTVHREELRQAESDIAVNWLQSGVYMVAILQNQKVVQRKKVFVP
jgi:hypothetical protein